MTGLPTGWATITIGEASGVGGLSTDGDWIESKDQDPTGSVRLIQLQDIGDGTFVNKSSRFLTEDKAEELNCTFLSPGDVLIARMPDPLGRACRFPDIGQKSVTAVDVHVWRKGEHGVEPDFLVYCVNSPEIRQSLQAQASGTTRQRVSGGRLKAQEIPLPPLPEQRRIVSKLDTLNARSTTARTHLTAIEKLVERYRTAVLEAEFRAAWDAGCNNTIAGCLEHAETGLVRSKAEQTADEGYPYIRMNHYDLAGRWNDRDLTYVAATSSEFARYQLRANDLLFNTRNSAELVGKVAIWPEGKDGYLFNNNLLRMRFSADVLPGFAFWQMSSPPFRRYIEGFISATTSVAAIYQRSLMAAPFWVPDTDEQREIIRRIETAFAKIDRLAAEAAKARKLLGHLDQRILAKAFAGDLVPQDPTDEPAETLLARIREARATAPKGKRRRTATTG